MLGRAEPGEVTACNSIHFGGMVPVAERAKSHLNFAFGPGACQAASLLGVLRKKPLGCLTYSHRLYLSRENRNILWLYFFTKPRLNRIWRPEVEGLFFQWLSSSHALARSGSPDDARGLGRSRTAEAGRFCTWSTADAVAPETNGT